MSKPGPRRNAHRRQKYNERVQKRKNRKRNQSLPVSSVPYAPLRGEFLGAPTAGANWLGQRIASLVRRHKR